MGFKHVAVGGTFDSFHKGHRMLLKKAVELGGRVTIGITSDRFAGPVDERFAARKAAVESYVSSLGFRSYSIVKLEDPFGPAASDDTMDCIVVSEETHPRAVELNNIRRKQGLNELVITKMPMLLAEDGGSLSSSRIRNSEIDSEGMIK